MIAQHSPHPKRCSIRRIIASVLVMASITGCGLSTYTDSATQRSDTEEKGVLRVSMSIEFNEVVSGDAIPVQLSLHNTGDSPAPFLPINTAFEEELSADVFDVMLDDESQPYLGIVARRLPPTADDVLMIGPDERLERTINITDYYQMDRAGEYHLRYAPQQLVTGEELEFDFAAVTIDSDQITVTIR